ncbi:MAG: shikimate dehydrogenase [Methanomicrobiales archaeon]|nr:shikimate dehydrogenase [Methanomicrobiales archaeon]
MTRIVLTGYRGSGKTTVGALLAEMLQVPWYDTDAMVEEQAGMPIPGIFAEEGEAGFRAREHAVIASLAGRDGVISAGGGAVVNPGNVALLRRGGTVVFLSAPPEVLEARIRGSPRPPLTGLSPDREIRTVLAERMAAYRGAADICVPAGEMAPEKVASAVLSAVTRGMVTPTDREQGLAFLAGTPLPPAERDVLTSRLRAPGEAPVRLCAVIGNPCLQSKSPLLFNHLFSSAGLMYYYTRIQWPDIDAIMACAAALDMKGLSVTIPFKAAVMPYCQTVDPHAAAIGAVNTVVRCGGELSGYNTDWIGVARPLAGVPADTAVVLGAGGAAASATYALAGLGMDVTVLARRREAAAACAARFGAASGSIDEFDAIRPDLVVNATPVGMGDGKSPLEKGLLRPGMVVFDLVYTPPETPLLRFARRRGCRCIEGRRMFTAQAAAQFRLFTGMEADPHTIREVI